jgi:hypothetical protein
MGDRRGSHLDNSESKIFRKRENKAEDRRRKFKREEKERGIEGAAFQKTIRGRQREERKGEKW